MKTLFVSLAALVAVSGAALAAPSDRNDPRDLDTNFSKFSAQNQSESYATDSNALSIVKGRKKAAFERMDDISEKGGKDNARDHDHAL
jgi:hypothetical protein